MTQQLTILIIDDDREARQAIENLLAPVADRVKLCASVADFAEGERLIQSLRPYVVFLGVRELETGLAQVRDLLTRFQRMSVFVTTHEKNPDWILRFMRAGADEYLLKPIDKIELFEALQKAGSLLLANHHGEPAVDGRIITVFNPVGGMGTTSIAVNLAACMIRETSKVALVDLNFFSGDVAVFLDINPRYTLSSVTSNLNRLDASFLMSVMSQHSSGVYILSEPLDVDDTLGITAEQIHRILAFLKSVFTFVIIDTGGHLCGINEMVFKHSDLILFNTVLNLPALQNARRYLTAMAKRGFSHDRIKLVVNRYTPKADIKVQDAEKILGRTVFATIPNEYNNMVESLNKGEPVLKLYPRSEVSKAIRALADQLMK
jgi:pilus assembly protein CpaE